MRESRLETHAMRYKIKNFYYLKINKLIINKLMFYLFILGHKWVEASDF